MAAKKRQPFAPSAEAPDAGVNIATETIRSGDKSYTLGFCPVCHVGVSGSASEPRAVAGVLTHMRAKHGLRAAIKAERAEGGKRRG